MEVLLSGTKSALTLHAPIKPTVAAVACESPTPMVPATVKGLEGIPTAPILEPINTPVSELLICVQV